MASIVVDTVALVCDLIGYIESALQKPFIFVDLEGVDLSRDGVIAIMQVLVPPNPVVHLVDIHTLQKEAFDASGSDNQSLRTILESKDYPKVFFDVRNDSDALYSHFQISLRGVIDVQLLEFASRPRRGRFVKGLAKCIAEDGGLGWGPSQKWQSIKSAGQDLFAPEKGGKYEVFLERPLSPALQEYCAQDVLVMPKLLTVYGRRIQSHLATQVNNEALARIVLSQSSNYHGKGRHMAIGPAFMWNGPRDGVAPDFPMSIVCSNQLADRCSLNDVAAAASKKPTAEKTTAPASTAGNAHHGQGLDGFEEIGNVVDLLKRVNFLDTNGEPTEALKKLQGEGHPRT